MRTIVIADGLTKEFLSREQPFAASPTNVGRAEIDRLLGRGKAYGQGPLPTCLRAVAEESQPDSGPRLIELRSAGPVLEILDPLLAQAKVLASASNVIPWQELWGEISPEDAGGESGLRFLVIGCHTEGRILVLASYLRNVLGYAEVAVCPHQIGRAHV